VLNDEAGMYGIVGLRVGVCSDSPFFPSFFLLTNLLNGVQAELIMPGHHLINNFFPIPNSD